MVAEMSTAFSDALLALSAFHSSYQLYGETFCGFTGFLLVGFAATAGALRFGQDFPSKDMIDLHMYFSWLASILGISCLAAAYHRQATVYSIANGHLAVAIALTLTSSLLSGGVHHYVSEAISSGSMLSLMILCVVKFTPLGLIGGVIYTVAGLVIGTRGYWLGLPRVDWFHYALIIGNIALMMGLKYKEVPIFYRPSMTSP